MTGRTSTLTTAALLAWRVLPATLDARTRTVRLLLVPALGALFYVALVLGAGGAPPGVGDAAASAAGVGGLVSALTVATLTVEDRFEGTRPLLAVAPRCRVTIVVARIVVACALATSSALVGLLPALLVTGPPRPGAWPTLLATILCAAPAGAALGLPLGVLGLRPSDPLLPSTVAEYLVPLVVGVVAPLEVLPDGLDGASRAVPLTHVVVATRASASTGASADVAGPLALALVTSVAWVLVAIVLQRALARSARRTGGHDDVL